MRKSYCALSTLLVCLLAIAADQGFASTAAPGFAVTDFATGFTNSGAFGIGPIGLAFDASGNLFVGDYFTGFLYKFPPEGGTASPATQLNTTPIGGRPAGLSFTKDGRLYLARQSPLNGGDVLEVDQSTGELLRRIAFIQHATALATDPISGDLFVSQACPCDNAIFRISNFATGPGTVSVYAPVAADGIVFGPDGTLYTNAGAVIAGTNTPNPGAITYLSLPVRIPNVDGIAFSADPLRPFGYGNRTDGVITKVDLTTSPPTVTDIVTGGSRGDFATVGFDGCLYATQTDRVVKVTNADGTCVPPPLGPLAPTNPAFLASGSFVIGNVNAVVGNVVTFWGAQWANTNALSAGPAPNAFKGFADTAPPSCGGTWTASPANSSNPPATILPFMAVIASSSVNQSGPVISGNVPKIVIVKTWPGYGPSPGQAGTGVVVAILCGS